MMRMLVKFALYVQKFVKVVLLNAANTVWSTAKYVLLLAKNARMPALR